MAFEKQNNKLKESLKETNRTEEQSASSQTPQEKKEDLTQEVFPSNSFENLLDPSIFSKIMAAFEDNQEEEDALAESQEYLNGLDPLEYDKAYSYYSQNNQMVVNDPKRELYAMANQAINPLTSSPKLESNENNQEIKKLRKEHQNVVTLPNSETYLGKNYLIVQH